MKRNFIIFFSLWMISLSATAQCAAKNDAIQPGEELAYKLKFNWKFIWINAGSAKMTLQQTTFDGRPAYRTELKSYTNKTIDRYFKMRDTLVSVTSLDLEPIFFQKKAEEGKHYTVDEVWFSYRNQKCIVKQERRQLGKETISDYKESDQCVFDMLSILLQARSFDPTYYKVGEKILFPMATGKQIEEQTLIYRGKKNFEAEDGVKYRCLVFSLVEYRKNKEKEVITFYVTDDLNHLPVRLDLYLNFGSAKAFLANIKGNRHPLTSIVED